MKRSLIIVLSCACALLIAIFGLTACGGSGDANSQDASNSSSASSSQDAADGEVDASDVSASNLSADEVHSVFEQAVVGMSEFYKGTTPVGESLYYAGGGDGENAIFVVIVPNSSESVIFMGPATVGEDNRLTVTDATTNSSITFSVTDNGDGTYSFSMGDQYGAAVMTKCSTAEIVNALTDVVVATSEQAAAQAQADAAAAATQEQSQE